MTSANTKFGTLGLEKPLLKAIYKMGYQIPTPIQKKTIPLLMQGRDVVAMARTGSGKSAAFIIPMIHKLKAHSMMVGVRAVCLSPTRELAMQTLRFMSRLGCESDLRFALITGGRSMDGQFGELAANPDVIVGCPGRLLHIVEETNLKLSSVQYVVFDEADRMFEMGFAQQCIEVLKMMPEMRQVALFSATLPSAVAEFVTIGLHNPHLIRLDVETKISESLTLEFMSVREEEKWSSLLFLCQRVLDTDAKSSTIVFMPTRHHVEYCKMLMEEFGFETVSIAHGSMDQEARVANVADFSTRRTRFLIVTDVAARGLDIPILNNVINFSFPTAAKLFVHRVGRAARQGRIGTAYNLVSNEELPYVVSVFLFMNKELDLNSDSADWKIGNIPNLALTSYLEFISKLHTNNIDVRNQYKCVTNSIEKYNKSRPSASLECVKRAKIWNASPFPIHPLCAEISSTVNPQAATLASDWQRAVEMKRMREKDSGAAQDKDGVSSQRSVISNQFTSKFVKDLNRSSSTLLETFKKQQEEHQGANRKRKRSKDAEKTNTYRDEEFFISYEHTNKHENDGYSINMQSAVMDLIGDSNETMEQQKRLYRWDEKKKKFVQRTMQDHIIASGKRNKNESGVLVHKTNKNKDSLKRYYERFMGKTNLRLQSVGEEEDRTLTSSAIQYAQRKARHMGDEGESGDEKGDAGPPKKKQKLDKEGKNIDPSKAAAMKKKKDKLKWKTKKNRKM